MKKISPKKVSERVVEEIENMIGSGMFAVGEKLPSVRELCELLDVGRSAVRDAITTLKGKGIVEVKQGEGAYVCPVNPANLFNYQLLLPNTKDVTELYQVRKILEPSIAEMAAEARTANDTAKLESCLTNGSINKWQADYDFHMAIVTMTGNQMLIQLMEFISAATKQAMSSLHQHLQATPDRAEAIEAQHLEIYEAIKRGNAQTAKKRMSEHLDYVENLLIHRVLTQP